ncbi:radical SAM protein [Paraburkholderia guartelaensis]|uniref:Radical SAM protein n=1 Tax=Paraburkholderia guartelaensis TaxID=2546446 RepID=A0A4R5L5J9_9BURK|nr:radical SAM protein [Paraburkholderia guartelaensis]TDG03835.1 radical SAM protein [Paraburkholderia guartelaensis]
MDRTERTIKWRSLPNVSNDANEPHNPLPAVCDVSVTNVCNAACDFCGFSREKKMAGPRRYLDPDAFERAMPMLRRRKIRYMTLQGGEPLVHPQIESLVSSATKAGIQCGVITNGWFLPRHIKQLAAAGLKRLLISIDSADMSEHEHNRGLPGLAARIREGITQAHGFGIPVCATVTVSHLVQYESLPETLSHLGFDSVVFSYPRRDAFGSTSLVYDENSKLVDLSRDELLEALSAIEALKKHFRVMDPSAALDEVARFVRGEQQRIPCIAGSKYFYIDWNLDVWRCEPWHEPMGSVFDLDRLPDQREPCNACMMGCYRHASVLMHGAKAVTDSVYALGRGELRNAVGLLLQRGVAYSLWALATEELPRTALTALAGRPGARRSSPQGA